jgi:hypothetical protein
MLFVTALLFAALPLTAQEGAEDSTETVEARFQADLLSHLIGEPFTLQLVVEVADAVEIAEWPELQNSEWYPLELLAVGEVTSDALAEGGTRYLREYRAVIWEPGDYTTPETYVEVRRADGATSNRVMVRSLFFTVPSVLDQSDLTLRPDEPPIWFGYIPLWMIGAAALVGGVALWRGSILYQSWQRRRSERLAVPVVVPPEQIALRQLADLRQQSPAVIYSGSADVLRTYLEARYQVPAQEQTTGELMDVLEHRTSFDDGDLETLRNLLHNADLVKFAGVEPDVSSAVEQLNDVYRWISERQVDADVYD